MMEHYRKIEDLKNEKRTPDAVFEGTKAASGWKSGKEVTEQDYDEAVRAFMNAPVDGRGVKECSVK